MLLNKKNLIGCALTLLMTINAHADNNRGLHPLPDFANTWTASDLAPLDKIIGNASYVGLGENVHATEGFSQAKLRLIKYLIEEKNFRAIAMETPWIDARITATYIATCNGTAKDALKGIFPVWWGQSVVDLFSWVCEFNQKHPHDPVTFYGFDVQNAAPDMISDLQNHLSKVIPEQSNQLIKGLSNCFGFGLDTETFNKHLFNLEMGSESISDEDNKLCLQGLDDLDKVLATLNSNDLNVQWTRIDSAGIRASQGEYYYLRNNYDASVVSRDIGMAYELRALHDMVAPHSKTIIWAHNTHLTLNHSAVKGSDITSNTMGYYLRQSLHSDYVAIALTGYKVQLHWPGREIDELPVPVNQSVETMLHKTTYLNSILDLNEDFLNVADEYDLGMESMIPRQQYNGVVYLDTCLPMEQVSPLKKKLPPHL